MKDLNYTLFNGTQDFEWRLERLFYEAYPSEGGKGREPLQYMISIAIKVSQYLVDKDFGGQECLIKTPDEVKSSLFNALVAVLMSDRTGEKRPTEWLSNRVKTLIEFGIFQKLLEPELKELKN